MSRLSIVAVVSLIQRLQSNCCSCYETLLAAWRVSLILVYIAGLLTKTTHRCLCKMSLLAGSVTFRCECRLDIGGTDAGWLGIVF